MPGTVKLEVVSGPITGQVFSFEEHDAFLFGRATDCHACLAADDTTASRHHFILEVNPPEMRIRDLGSLNGTFINGVKHGGRNPGETPEEARRRRFPEVDLRSGDRIQVGETIFTVQVEIPASREAAPIRCGNCGRDVTAEVPAGAGGDYICAQCQKTETLDPASVLMKQLLDEARARGEHAPVDIAGYEILRMIEQGGMGAVYLARRRRDERRVAVKVMLAAVAVDERARQMFQREIEITRSLRHPHLVDLLDHGSAGSGFYFVMELCEGGGVHHLVRKRGGRLSLSEAAPIMVDALDGLAFAHAQGFVHRDLKPSNILLTLPEGRAKIADFGFAKNFQKAGLSGMTATGSTAGTAVFMPKEQLTNFKFVKPVSDVWSLGATFYNMLTGALPREFPVGEDPIQVILQAPVIPIRERDPNVPPRVAAVIDRAIATGAQDRYQSGGDFQDALRHVL